MIFRQKLVESSVGLNLLRNVMEKSQQTKIENHLRLPTKRENGRDNGFPIRSTLRDQEILR